jgi:hypothetical protein
VLGLNFSYFNQMIKSVVSTTEVSNIKRIVIVDNNGTGIADSSFGANYKNNKNIESFKNLVNQQHHDIIQQFNDKFNRELMLAKQCLKEGDLPDYHLHRIEADKRHRKLEQR